MSQLDTSVPPEEFGYPDSFLKYSSTWGVHLPIPQSLLVLQTVKISIYMKYHEKCIILKCRLWNPVPHPGLHCSCLCYHDFLWSFYATTYATNSLIRTCNIYVFGSFYDSLQNTITEFLYSIIFILYIKLYTSSFFLSQLQCG